MTKQVKTPKTNAAQAQLAKTITAPTHKLVDGALYQMTNGDVWRIHETVAANTKDAAPTVRATMYLNGKANGGAKTLALAKFVGATMVDSNVKLKALDQAAQAMEDAMLAGGRKLLPAGRRAKLEADAAAAHSNQGKPLTKKQKLALDREEKAVGKQNSAKIKADARAKPPEPKVLQVGSGAAIGVAAGAMDGQPHTKRAVAEARAREAAKAKASLNLTPTGKPVKVDGALVPGAEEFLASGPDGKVKMYVWKGRPACNATNFAEQVRASKRVAAEGSVAKQPKANTPKGPPKAKAPAADQKITVVNKQFDFGGAGTARSAAWEACKRAKTTAEYKAAGGPAKYLPRWVAAGAIKLG